MDKSSLGDRMKEAYEARSRTYLTKRTPVILRLDGKAFHTFTRRAKKPFDDTIIQAMQDTARYLIDNIQGARLAYTQSDEISILICDYDRHESEAWFDYQVQKICSVAASMATAVFNRSFFGDFTGRLAMFDCRAFNIPKEEVSNYFLWRYQDWSRNSISMVAQSMFSHSQLQGKSCDLMSTMIYEQGWRWEQYPASWTHGTFFVKSKYNEERGGEHFADLRVDRDWINALVKWEDT